MSRGAILLAGGRSTRMGRPKALLDWHGAPLAAHLAAVLVRAVEGGPVVVVGAPGQELPALPAGVEAVADAVEGRGPLQGLHAGLEALAGRAEVAFLASVDAPLLQPAFVQRVLAAVDDEADAAVPVAHGHRHPLLAAYRTSLAGLVAQLLAEDRLRPAFVLDAVRTRWLDEDTLLADPALGRADPGLGSVRNVNTPEEYEEVCALPLPRVEVVTYGVARLRAGRARVSTRAVRLGQAAAAAGVELDGHVVAAVNGVRIVRDPLFPLVDGDAVALVGADAGG